MERLAQSAFVRAFRAYLSRRELERARQEVIEKIPKQGTWFLCEVDGQDYAVRVLRTGCVEVMQSIFSLASVGTRNGTEREEVLALPLFQDGQP